MHCHYAFQLPALDIKGKFVAKTMEEVAALALRFVAKAESARERFLIVEHVLVFRKQSLQTSHYRSAIVSEACKVMIEPFSVKANSSSSSGMPIAVEIRS